MEEEYPSNSLTSKPAKPEEAKDDKKVDAIDGIVVHRRRKPLGARFKETFIAGEAKGVVGYILMEVVLPQVKDLIVEAATQGIERAIFGDSRPSTRRFGASRMGTGHTNYTRYSSAPATRREDPRREASAPARSPRRTDRPHFDEIVFASRHEAEEVISRLNDMIARYETASFADLYSIVNERSNYIDDKWGWVDLTGAGVRRIGHEQYVLNLPQPVSID